MLNRTVFIKNINVVLQSGPEVNFFDHQPLRQVDLKIHLPQ